MGSLRGPRCGVERCGDPGSRVWRWAWTEEWWRCLYRVLKNALPQGVAVVGSPELLEGRSYEGAEGTDAEEMVAVRRCGV